MSNPQVNPGIYLAVMDIFEARRQAVLELVRTRFKDSKSKFAAAAKIGPSYVTRMLSEPRADPQHKRIETVMAKKIERNLDLDADEILSPLAMRAEPPPRKSIERRVRELLADGELSAALAAKLVEEAHRTAQGAGTQHLPPNVKALVDDLLLIKNPGEQAAAAAAAVWIVGMDIERRAQVLEANAADVPPPKKLPGPGL